MSPTVPPELETPLLAWLALLDRWNGTHALTALPPGERWEELIQDACALLPHLAELASGATVVDLGTGMGSPAVVLALARPDLHILGIDASAKKLAFVRQSAMELKLPNLETLHGRFEVLPPIPGDLAVAKALAPLHKLTTWWSRLGNPKAPLLALKGPEWNTEPLPAGWKAAATPYDLPTRGRRFVIHLSH